MFRKHVPIDPQGVLQPSRISQTSFCPYKIIKTHQKSIFSKFRPKIAQNASNYRHFWLVNASFPKQGARARDGGFQDESSYPKLKFGGRKVSFRCLLKSDVQKTCSYRSATCFAAIPHIPNRFLPIQVYQNSSKIEFFKISTGNCQKCW